MNVLLPTPRQLAGLALSVCAVSAGAQSTPRDEFYWLGQINKASVVVNAQQGLLQPQQAKLIANSLEQVLADGQKDPARRPRTVITFEPLLIRAGGQEVTLLHAGRSSQDMHATYRAAILRDETLQIYEQLLKVQNILWRQATEHQATAVPNYTNGVAAQPNSYGHYLLGHAAGFERDAQRLRQALERLNRSPMGTTVLNGSSWPLNREKMAQYLGFPELVDNAYDASQISSSEHPVELGSVLTAMALHVGHFVEDVMTQYAQPEPWIMLQTGNGNTYVSSAMPQKKNPGLLNDTRRLASTAIALGQGPMLRAHNITPGMPDPKEVRDNSEMMRAGLQMLQHFERVLTALRINPERALQELNNDWTASQELVDVLMREHQLPFRLGHHFASEVVDHAKAHGYKPTTFPYEQARRIYRETLDKEGRSGEFPLTEAQFKAVLDPQQIIRHRATSGGPQKAEMQRMLERQQRLLQQQAQWLAQQRERVSASAARLNVDFAKVLAP